MKLWDRPVDGEGRLILATPREILIARLGMVLGMLGCMLALMIAARLAADLAFAPLGN